MSRSYKKNPIGGHTKKESEKDWKREQNRKLRHKVKSLLNSTQEEITLDVKDISDIWLAPKDGKSYYGMAEKKDMRK